MERAKACCNASNGLVQREMGFSMQRPWRELLYPAGQAGRVETWEDPQPHKQASWDSGSPHLIVRIEGNVAIRGYVCLCVHKSVPVQMCVHTHACVHMCAFMCSCRLCVLLGCRWLG